MIRDKGKVTDRRGASIKMVRLGEVWTPVCMGHRLERQLALGWQCNLSTNPESQTPFPRQVLLFPCSNQPRSLASCFYNMHVLITLIYYILRTCYKAWGWILLQENKVLGSCRNRFCAFHLKYHFKQIMEGFFPFYFYFLTRNVPSVRQERICH